MSLRRPTGLCCALAVLVTVILVRGTGGTDITYATSAGRQTTQTFEQPRARGNFLDRTGRPLTGIAQTGQFDAAGDELLNYWFGGFTPVETPKYTITVLQDGVLELETSSAALSAKNAEGLKVIEQPASD